jgi:hypothetical protein
LSPNARRVLRQSTAGDREEYYNLEVGRLASQDDKLMTDPESDSEIMLAQFNRLIQELLRGGANRNTFRPWEVELLLDMESCDLKESRRKEILKRYQRAVQKQMERGAAKPLKLSEYLEAQRAKRERLKAMKSGSGE